MSETLADIRARAERLYRQSPASSAEEIDYQLRLARRHELAELPQHMLTYPLREWIRHRMIELAQPDQSEDE